MNRRVTVTIAPPPRMLYKEAPSIKPSMSRQERVDVTAALLTVAVLLILLGAFIPPP